MASATPPRPRAHNWRKLDSCGCGDVEPMSAQLLVEGCVALGEPCDIRVCCESVAVRSGGRLEPAAAGCVLVPSGRAYPLGALAGLPFQSITDEGKLDRGAIRGHRG